MAQILVRDVDARIVERLKTQARRHGRSLQGEVKVILVNAAAFSLPEARAVSAQWHKRLAGRSVSDSAKLLREDRQR